jgi:hypothetical protein
MPPDAMRFAMVSIAGLLGVVFDVHLDHRV